MRPLTVEKVTTARQRRQFLEFPWQLYKGDPNWIPPLRSNQMELVGYKAHPFHERNTVQTFLALRGDEVCGRVAAILNQGHIHRFDDRRGFFGFFECTDDQQVASALFDAARQWFADQGIFKLRGPTNPSLNYELALLIEGFDSPPTFMMTYNPPYYARLLENYGFQKAQDLYAYWGHVSILPEIHKRLTPVARQIMEHCNVSVRPLDRKNFLKDVLSFLHIYNRSLMNTWGFVPMTDGEVRHVADGLKHLIVPELAIGAEVDGEMVGTTFALPDYNPRIREIDGRLFPFGFLRLLRNRRQIKRVRVISTNVVPEFQRMGVGLVLMHGLVPKGLDWQLEEAEFSWVLESNLLSRGSLEKGGAKITKKYRIYDFDDPNPPEPLRPERRYIARPSPPAPQGALEVREVKSKHELDVFLQLPWEIYVDDPHWIPPLLIELREFLDRRRHPFYLHGDAAQFIAYRGGQAVGRVLASDDPNYNRQTGESVGCFGMFECQDDPDAAAALLDAAAGWARAHGRSALRGPIDYSMNYPCGLLIDGFDTPPRVMMNHNPVYYPRLLESWGLLKRKDLCAWWFTDPHNMVERWRVRAERIARRTGLVVRSFRRAQFADDMRRCQDVYNNSMRQQWGFVQLTDAEFAYAAQQLRRVAVPEQVLLAEIDDQSVGFAVTIPDWNEAIRPLNGRLTRFGLPINLMRLMRRKQKIHTARMMVLDVLEPYRRRGVAEMLILRTLDHGKNVLGYTGAELSWTLEDNHLVNSAIQTVGGRRYKTYRIYEKAI
ncbi:MAG: hypothetical protein ACOY3P_25665 [Planctomycetota bacterium]